MEDLQLAGEEEVVRWLGWLDVNSIAVRGHQISLEILLVSLVASDIVSMAGEDGPYKGRGIYPVTSLLNHACISNTRNIVTGRTLEVRLFNV